MRKSVIKYWNKYKKVWEMSEKWRICRENLLRVKKRTDISRKKAKWKRSGKVNEE